MLTPRNREVIDRYLPTDPECGGNGAAAYQHVYGCSRESAWNGWSRLIRNSEAEAYLSRQKAEIEEARRVEIAFDRDRYMATLERLLHVTSQQYVGEDGQPHIEDPAEARRIAKDLYAAESGNVFPFQQDNGVRVSINIDTQWRGILGTEPIDVTETPDEPPESEEEPPRVVIIGRK